MFNGIGIGTFMQCHNFYIYACLYANAIMYKDAYYLETPEGLKDETFFRIFRERKNVL